MSRSILRTLLPEAYVTLDDTTYPIGGVTLTTHHSFLDRSNFNATILPNSFQFDGYLTLKPDTPFHWEPGLRHAPTDVKWPPEGLTLGIAFKPPPEVAVPSHANVIVHVKYEMYEGVPILAKWLTVENLGSTPVRVDGVVIEKLGTQKPYAPLALTDHPSPWENDDSAVTSSWLYVEADTPHGPKVSWANDPDASSSPGADEPILTVSYDNGPGVMLGLPQSHKKFYRERLRRQSNVPMRNDNSGPPVLMYFDTFRVLELVTDSNDRERVGLSRHRMTRLLAPQTQENPIFFHCTNATDAGFKAAVDQMYEVGFEMFIYSFGSQFHLEDISDMNMKKVAANIAYAKSKGIEVGG